MAVYATAVCYGVSYCIIQKDEKPEAGDKLKKKSILDIRCIIEKTLLFLVFNLYLFHDCMDMCINNSMSVQEYWKIFFH
jgi:hypothetical protein